MRHIEEKVILAQLNLLAVVVELRHALGADHYESLIVETKFTLGQHSEVLHYNQLVAIVYPQCVSTSSRYEIFYLHAVRFLLFWCKITEKYPNFAVRYFPKNALLHFLYKKELFPALFGLGESEISTKKARIGLNDAGFI